MDENNERNIFNEVKPENTDYLKHASQEVIDSHVKKKMENEEEVPHTILQFASSDLIDKYVDELLTNIDKGKSSFGINEYRTLGMASQEVIDKHVKNLLGRSDSVVNVLLFKHASSELQREYVEREMKKEDPSLSPSYFDDAPIDVVNDYVKYRVDNDMAVNPYGYDTEIIKRTRVSMPVREMYVKKKGEKGDPFVHPDILYNVSPEVAHEYVAEIAEKGLKLEFERPIINEFTTDELRDYYMQRVYGKKESPQRDVLKSVLSEMTGLG